MSEMTNPTDPRIEAAARAIAETMLRHGKAPDAQVLAQAALKAADAAAWRPMSEAKKDRTPVLVKIHDDLFPRICPERKDLEPWNGRWVVVSHPGVLEDGFDIGWGVAAPVGCGGFPDDWFVGWQSLPSAPLTGGRDE